MERWLWVAVWVAAGAAIPLPNEVDSEQTRKLLGSSVVTSVSVIMEHGNGTKTYLTDGEADKKPQIVGTPGTLLSPDRYEFYSFGDDGELVKKLMTLDQIQSLIAGGDDLEPLPVYDPQPLEDNSHNEGVHKVLESVQNVLKGELQAAKIHPKVPMPLPDDSWSILLPGLLNSDLDLKEPHIPLKLASPTTTTSAKPESVSEYSTSGTRRPTTPTVKYTTTGRPMTSFTQQQPAVYSTGQQLSGESTTTTKKPTSDTRYTSVHTTNAPLTKTTGHIQAPKPQSQKPQVTTKRPHSSSKRPVEPPFVASTKKPYVSETLFVTPTKRPYVSESSFVTPTKKPYVSEFTKKPYVEPVRVTSTKKPFVNESEVTSKKPYTSESQLVSSTKKPYLSESQFVSSTKKPYLSESQFVSSTQKPYSSESQFVSSTKKPYLGESQFVSTQKPYLSESQFVSSTHKPYLSESQFVSSTQKPYSSESQFVSSTKKPYLGESQSVSTQKPYLSESQFVSSTHKPYLSESQFVSSTQKPYLSESQFVSSTHKPYLSESQFVSSTQKPYSGESQFVSSTKKPYLNESPSVKIPLSSTPKPETTTTSQPTTTAKLATTVEEERTPITKYPDFNKKPLPEKQKPSGIPTITHYMPISSISPSSTTQKLTTQSFEELTTLNQKFTSTSKEPIEVTTTKRPTPMPTSSTTVHKATRKPVQNKVPVTNNKTQPNNKYQNDKIIFKNPKPTVPSTTTTKTHQKTTAAPTTVAVKSTMEPTTVKETATSTEKLDTLSTTDVEMTTIVKDSILPSAEKWVAEKQQESKPQNNLLAQNSNIISTKVKPSSSPIPASGSTASEKLTPTSAFTHTTPYPDRITTFSYTSRITPNGEIITSHQPVSSFYNKKPTAGTSIETPSTQHPTTTNIKTTEEPQKKLAASLQQALNPIESVRDHILVSSSMQPTTYHPHNFSLPSKKPTGQHISSTTPMSSTQMKLSTITEPQKHTTITSTTSVTKAPTEHSSTNAFKTQPPTTPSTASDATTLQEVTKPTTLFANMEETTAGTAAIISKTTTYSINDKTTYSSEEMPLQEIPLKIYESLKDNAISAQDIMTTILFENLSTTPSKTDNIYSTNSEETTAPSTTVSSDKGTTIFDAIDSSTSPFSQNKVVIINNSEPQILEKSSIPFVSTNESELNATTTVDPKNSSTFVTKVKEESTTVPANISDRETIETTPNLDSTTMYRDQILQEGISAVTSILLDEATKQEAMKQAVLAAVIKNKDPERIKTTTENELMSTTVSDSTDLPTEKVATDGDDMKSEVRLDEDAELPENITTETIATTAMEDKTKPEILIIKDDVKKPSNNTNNKQHLQKTEHKTTPVIPTKESKLNPDNDHEIVKKTADNHFAENPPLLRTSPVPEFFSTTERLKILDIEKPIPKPLSPYVKKPSSIYQSLDNQPPLAIDLNPAPYESMGLEASIAFLGEDVRRFADLCNELAFKLWTSITGKGQIASRSLVMSPFAVTSLLAMVFLGARGPTSGQMNDVLRLDDMVTFNPHQVLQNVTESVINSKNNGVATAAFVRELYSDKSKGKILDFYKERVQQYYQGHVEEVTFSTIGDIIRRRTNLLVKRQTLGKVPEYLRGSSLNMRPPLASFSANIFQTDCEHGSTEGRDGEMYFVVRPSTRQRRLVPVPAVVWRSGFLAGYETSLDATSVCLGPESVVSTILILPGQQGQVAPGDGLARLEQRLIETSYRRGGWSQILRSLMPRPGLELQIPRFSHRSVLNVTGSLQRMGLRDLFNARRADLRGLNGLSNDLHLSDMLQVNTFSTCGEETIGARHHVETYPASPQRMGRDEPEHYLPRDFDNTFGELPLSLRPRQARLPDNPRLRFDRPFLYMVRHNPSGMILHMGRFNPRLLP